MILNNVRYILEWFEKDPGDDFIGQEDLAETELSKLKSLFDIPSKETMAGGFKIELQHLAEVQKLVEHRIDLDKYDYFVSTTRAN